MDKISSDEELAQQLANGREMALREIVHRYEMPLRNYVRRRCFSCQSEVDDILQDVFLRVFTHIREFDAGLKFSAWIYRITHNIMISRIRRHSVRGNTLPLEPELIPSDIFRTDAPLESRELRQAISDILGHMPDKLRNVFVLRFLEGKDYAEIGDILRENVNTVATWIRRGRASFLSEANAMGLRLYLED
ncbi:MAG TPA: RNA polymerase sigma factor [Fibrobacteraceae bacterium]|nr:RNA polymerase sigma factor [Fibrobacteraceae bacterium]